jgi:hypothetical protein
MSRKHRHGYCYDEKCYDKGRDNCCCSFPTLVVLILIILQFNKGGFFGAGHADGVGKHGFTETVDNSILFIIALFYLSCCNPCKR